MSLKHTLKFIFIIAIAFSFFFHLQPVLAGGILESKINQILASANLHGTRISIKIVSLPHGEVLYEKNPDLALNPASNVKLVTAAAAFRTLGPYYTFKTEFYSNRLIDKKGRIKDLWIKGYGDPFFVTEELESIVLQLTAAGLHEVTGSIYVDDTFFDHYNLTTYFSDSEEAVYDIVTGPLSYNFNVLKIKARPGLRLGDHPIIQTDPDTGYFKIKNEAETTGRRTKPKLNAELDEKNLNHLTIRGGVPKTIREYSLRRGILDPTTYTGTIIMEALEKGGVALRGGLSREAVPPRALMIFSHTSAPLKEILKGMGKFSNNFIAEQVVKTLGAVSEGPPGSTEKGLQLLKKYLISLGIDKSRFTLDNGSGLSRLSRLSADQIIRVLVDIERSEWKEDMVATLSVSGIDGTLRYRMIKPPLRGRVFAKTGTLNDASSLSGYIVGSSKTAAFSILFNDFRCSHNRVDRVKEEILKAVFQSLH